MSEELKNKEEKVAEERDLFGTAGMPEPDPEQFIDHGTYFVYGMAIGVLVGAVLFFLFGQNRILLCAATLIGMVIGACIKKKG